MSAGSTLLLELLDEESKIGEKDVVKRLDVMHNLQLFKLSRSGVFVNAASGETIKSKSIAVDLQTRELLSKGAYGERLAERIKVASEAEVLRRPLPPRLPPPGGPDKHLYRPASKSGAMKCAACQCYSKTLAETGRCNCGKKRKYY